MKGSVPNKQFNYESQHGNIHFAASFTGLSVSCLYKKVAEDKIPYYRIPNSNRLIFFKADLALWLRNET